MSLDNNAIYIKFIRRLDFGLKLMDITYINTNRFTLKRSSSCFQLFLDLMNSIHFDIMIREQLLCPVVYFNSFIGMDLNNKLESVEHEMRLVYNAMLKPQ